MMAAMGVSSIIKFSNLKSITLVCETHSTNINE